MKHKTFLDILIHTFNEKDVFETSSSCHHIMPHVIMVIKNVSIDTVIQEKKRKSENIYL